MKINSWEEAIRHNRELAHDDIIKLKNQKAFHLVREAGDLLDPRTVPIFSLFFDFVIEQQEIRRRTGDAQLGWAEFCSRQDSHLAYLGPRWTLPFCYFSPEYAYCFEGTIGLDVGCNVFPKMARKVLDNFNSAVKDLPDYLWDFETLVPHYTHYRTFGCHMQGIDIRPMAVHCKEVGYGDLRMLGADDEGIDFFAVAMIFGPGNPASTYLDTALCLAELKRTCHRHGLIYLADFIVMPPLVACAVSAGFRVFANNSYQYGVPIGIFFIKDDFEIKKSSFRPIMEYLLDYELCLPQDVEVRIINRELLRKNKSRPKILIR